MFLNSVRNSRWKTQRSSNYDNINLTSLEKRKNAFLTIKIIGERVSFFNNFKRFSLGRYGFFSRPRPFWNLAVKFDYNLITTMTWVRRGGANRIPYTIPINTHFSTQFDKLVAVNLCFITYYLCVVKRLITPNTPPLSSLPPSPMRRPSTRPPNPLRAGSHALTVFRVTEPTRRGDRFPIFRFFFVAQSTTAVRSVSDKRTCVPPQPWCSRDNIFTDHARKKYGQTYGEGSKSRRPSTFPVHYTLANVTRHENVTFLCGFRSWKKRARRKTKLKRQRLAVECLRRLRIRRT